VRAAQQKGELRVRPEFAAIVERFLVTRRTRFAVINTNWDTIIEEALTTPLMILIAGPYRSGTGDDPAKLAANVRAMEAFALPLFRAGHIPVVGEWLALPLVALAGSRRIRDAAFDEVFHPIAERLLARCDAVLRMGGASQGADLMVQVARQRGLAVFASLNEVPGCAPS
jgi:hypothetical protein